MADEIVEVQVGDEIFTVQVPEGTSDADIEAFLSNGPEAPSVNAESSSPFAREFADQLIEKTAAIPSASGEFAGGLFAGAATIPQFLADRMFMGGEGGSFTEMFERQQEQFPASLMRETRRIPRPSSEEVQSFVRALPELMPGGLSFSEARESLRQDLIDERRELQVEHPFATGAADVASDALMMTIMRSPFVKQIDKIEDVIMNGKIAIASSPGVGRLIQRTLNERHFRELVRGAGRAGEAAGEAMILDIMDGDDPLETAGIAAATQVIGGLGLEGLEALKAGGVAKAGVKIAMLSLAVGSLWETAQNIAPGVESNWIRSLEGGFDKVALGIGAGLLAGAAGLGRSRGTKLAEDVPVPVDWLTSLPRNFLFSSIERLADAPIEEQNRVVEAMNAFGASPDSFSEETRERLDRAIGNGRYYDELNKLSQESKFQAELFLATSAPNGE